MPVRDPATWNLTSIDTPDEIVEYPVFGGEIFNHHEARHFLEMGRRLFRRIPVAARAVQYTASRPEGVTIESYEVAKRCGKWAVVANFVEIEETLVVSYLEKEVIPLASKQEFEAGSPLNKDFVYAAHSIEGGGTVHIALGKGGELGAFTRLVLHCTITLDKEYPPNTLTNYPLTETLQTEEGFHEAMVSLVKHLNYNLDLLGLPIQVISKKPASNDDKEAQ